MNETPPREDRSYSQDLARTEEARTTTSRRVRREEEHAERRRRAIALRRKGASYREIAGDLGIAPSSARKLYTTSLERTWRGDAELARDEELDRLNAMRMHWWPIVFGAVPGSDPPQPYPFDHRE